MTIVTLLNENLKTRLGDWLEPELGKIFCHGDRVAIKLHMGEVGNPYYLKPHLVQPIIDALKSVGAAPFLFDTPTLYNGKRGTPGKYLRTAAGHGYKEAIIGCPVIISDESIAVTTKHLVVGVSKVIAESDGLLVATHVKGHSCCGFGGAIKNIGMGAVDKRTKKAIHTYSRPSLDPERCIGCGQCESVCPDGAVKLRKGAPVFSHLKCWGCDQCIVKCDAEALTPERVLFDVALSEAAGAVLSRVNKRFFVNYLMNISELCDCLAKPGKIIVDDIGIILGDDIIAVDKASNDRVIEKAGYDIFEELHSKSGLVHIKAGAGIGLGVLDYELDIG